MSEPHEILVNALANSGVIIPSGVNTINDLTPLTLFSVCSNAIHLIDPKSTLPESLPDDSMSARFHLCSNLAKEFTKLGFIGDISFHKFLYPSEEDLYKLVRFLAERLPGSSENGNNVVEKIVSTPTSVGSEEFNVASTSNNQFHGDGSLQLQTEKLGLQDAEEVRHVETSEASAAMKNVQGLVIQLKDEKICDDEVVHPVGEQDREGLPNVNSLDQHSFEVHLRLLSEEAMLTVESYKRLSELEDLLDELELLKSADEMAFDDKDPISFHQNQISDQLQVKNQSLLEAESQWEATKKSMEEKCRSLEESVSAKLPEAYKKLEQVKTIEHEMELVLAATKQRDEDLLKLHSDLEKQPKLAPRKSYIERIKEITKNSRKQDIDVERILKETRELQLDSNSIQERLHRTYAVVDETVFREAKKDPGKQQLYRLLAIIHENFEHIPEEILETDRTRREVADYETKLAAITSRSLNLDKLNADLDAIRKENELLAQRINHI
ncbi:hypothetical protein Leryth_012009 [Lithospermum erythrorhizon]|nr:hypothetical protein Leryth_012009 [Lithospermum erythrorhizon]